MKVIELPKKTLHPEGTPLMEFEFPPVIHRMVDKYGWEERRAEEAFKGLKSFLQEAIVSGKPVEPTNPDVDEMWHNFIIFTQDYGAFCRTYAGFFIHHRPYHRDDPQRANGKMCCYGCEEARMEDQDEKDDLKD